MPLPLPADKKGQLIKKDGTKSQPTAPVASKNSGKTASTVISNEKTTHQLDTSISKAKPTQRVVNPPTTPVTVASESRPKIQAKKSRLNPTTQKPNQRLEDGTNKLFVLDTNVLLHDPSSLFRFDEHDVFLPMITLEELDNHKQGMSEVARNARTVSRTLDALIASYTKKTGSNDITQGIALDLLGNRDATGYLYFQTDAGIASQLGQSEKADNQILTVVAQLKAKLPNREVILVSKDINMRLKAHTLLLPAEDYFNDQVLEDSDLLYSGSFALPQDFWEQVGKTLESWQDNKSGNVYYRFKNKFTKELLINEFAYLEPADGSAPFYAIVEKNDGVEIVLRTLIDYTSNHHQVWGINARNREQLFAMNLLMDPNIDMVTMLGQAGTGKTLLALAAGLECVIERKLYTEIIITRATVSVGDDIGFLPGTEEEKMQPWMGAIDDNLEVLQKTDSTGGEWGKFATQDLIRARLRIKSMSFMRGRTFTNKFVIIDEAQNLTPKQIKTLITRAGTNTKIICLGNISQIDTPYLTEGSSGLTYLVDRFKGWQHGGHITLARGERSRLADYAADIL